MFPILLLPQDFLESVQQHMQQIELPANDGKTSAFLELFVTLSFVNQSLSRIADTAPLRV